jgi:hypothetical protein
VGYYRCFIHDYSAIADALTRLLCKGNFKWSSEVEGAFRVMQLTLKTASVLQLPTFNCAFVVECDASGRALARCCTKGPTSTN